MREIDFNPPYPLGEILCVEESIIICVPRTLRK